VNVGGFLGAMVNKNKIKIKIINKIIYNISIKSSPSPFSY
jgi:hypothetical protein